MERISSPDGLTVAVGTCMVIYMNPTTTLTATNLSEARWITSGRLTSFDAGRYFGIVDGSGRALTFDGITPAAWTTKAVAKTIAEGGLSCDAMWIELA